MNTKQAGLLLPWSLSAALITSTASVAAATTLNVPGQFPTIQSAVDAAALNDTVLVAPGTYTGTGNRNIYVTRDVVVRSSAGPKSTVIDCEGSTGVYRGFYLDGSSTEATVIEGLTIQHGWAYGSALDGGGAILCWSPSVTIRNCILVCNAVASPHCPAGLAPEGSADGSASSNGLGGAIRGYASSPKIIDCVIAGNYADYGTAISCWGPSLTIIRSVIAGNGGGGGHDAISFYGDSLTIIESTITGNFGGTALRARGEATLERSILWGNCSAPGVALEAVVDTGSALAFTCCAVDSSAVEGLGQITYAGENVYTDPLFCGPEPCQDAPTVLGDYRLRADSPCLPGRNACGVLIGALGEGPGTCNATSVPAGFAGPLSLTTSPNPFQSAVSILYAGSRSETGEAGGLISIHDVTGRRVQTFDLRSPSGTLAWDGTDFGGQEVANGIYFLRLVTGGGGVTARITRIR